MLLQPSGILPVWVEDATNAYALCFVESPSEGDWVPEVVPVGEKRLDAVYAGSVRFYHHVRNPKLRAQTFAAFRDPSPFLWRVWDEAGPEFEWFVKFGDRWWWVPLREYRGDDNSPHTIRFQVKAEAEPPHPGRLRRVKKIYVFIRNLRNLLLCRLMFENPDFA